LSYVNVNAPVEIVTGPAAVAAFVKLKVPVIEMLPPELVAAISKSASDVKLSPPAAPALSTCTERTVC